MIIINAKNHAFVLFSIIFVGLSALELLDGFFSLFYLTLGYSFDIACSVVSLTICSFLIWAANDDKFLAWSRQDMLGDKYEDYEVLGHVVWPVQNHGALLEKSSGRF